MQPGLAATASPWVASTCGGRTASCGTVLGCGDPLNGVRVKRFLENFDRSPSPRVVGEVWREPRLVEVDGYLELAESVAGCSFDNGLYRFHDATTGPVALGWIAVMFPEMAARVRPFGYDWLGRQFVVDSGRRADGQQLVAMLDPGTGQVFEIPAPFVAFHDEELVDYRNDALASDFFGQWAQANGALLPLGRDDCVGRRVPLFLGGSDAVDNLEVTDLDVYWTLHAQLREGTRHLPEGTLVEGVSDS